MTLQRRLQLVSGLRRMPMLKVAFASSDMRRVNQHFGSAGSFVIYGVGEESVCCIEACEFDHVEMDGNEDKLVAKIAALEGCVAVYSEAVGASAVRQLKARGIQPVKVMHGASISKLLSLLQDELQQGPTGWLARAIEGEMGDDPGRFDQMEAEGWQE